VVWNKRDTILYALSIGAHNDDFKVIYGDRSDANFQVFPTFATSLSLKGPDLDVTDFEEKLKNEKRPPGFPDLPPALTHDSQYLEILEALPLVSTPGFKVTKKCVGIHESSTCTLAFVSYMLTFDPGAGITFDNEITLVGPDGKKYARMIARFPPSAPIASLGKPSWTCVGPTWPEQSVLYRLNGDYNPLHIDPKRGEALNFGGLICHGLGMYGITARAILEKMSSNDPSNLKSITAQFIGPITPGDDLQISIWELGRVPGGQATLIAFEARNPVTGNLCLGEGRAHIIKTTVLPEGNPNATGFQPNPPLPIIPANGPRPTDTVPKWVPRIMGIPITTLATVLFFLPAIIANLLYVIFSYLWSWWWQW
ncbi:hypothetical protein DL93DRAFT_2176253, partial [Clavulina sp. PMI_390]